MDVPFDQCNDRVSDRLESVRVVLLDLDGVLYVEQALVPGARDAVERLRSLSLTLRFVTNTTSHSRAETPCASCIGSASRSTIPS